MLEKTLVSPLDYQKIKPVHPKGNQSWIFIGRTDAESEAPILWPPDEKNWLIGKDPDAEADWRQEEKGTTDDEMVGWHHWPNGHSLSKLWELVMDRKAQHAGIHRVANIFFHSVGCLFTLLVKTKVLLCRSFLVWGSCTCCFLLLVLELRKIIAKTDVKQLKALATGDWEKKL